MKTVNVEINVDNKEAVKSVNQLEQELAQLQEEFKSVEIGSKEFDRLGKAIQKTSSQIKDIELQFEALDKEQRATALVDTFNGMVGAVGAVTSAMIAFGSSTEEIEEAEKKLLGVIGVVQGLSEASNGLIALNKLTGGSFTALGTQISTAFKTGEISAISFRTVLQSLGIGLLITGITLLVTNLDAVAEALGLATDQGEKFKESNENLNKELDKGNTSLNLRVRELKAQGASEKEILQVKVRQNIADLEALRNQKALLEAKLEGRKATEAEQEAFDDLANRIEEGRVSQLELLQSIVDFDKAREKERADAAKKEQEDRNKKKKEREKEKEEAEKAAQETAKVFSDLEGEFLDGFELTSKGIATQAKVLKDEYGNTIKELPNPFADTVLELPAQAEIFDNTFEKLITGFKASAAELSQSTADALSSFSGLYDTIAQDETKTEAQRKKAFETSKKLRRGQVLIDSSSAAIGIFQSSTTLPEPFATINRVIQLAALAASTKSSLNAIDQATFEGGGSPATTSGGTRPVASFGATPQLTQSGAPNVGGQVFTPNEAPVVKAYVLAGDVTSSQQANEKIKQKRKL